MITGIKRIKGLGVFDNFVAANDLPDFRRFNVVYGENGSGKTTLSRLFTALELGEHREHPDLDFTINTEAGALIKGQKHSRKIRVFNSDYIDANIGQFDGPIPHILILGQENKEIAEKLKIEVSIHQSRVNAISAASTAIQKHDADKGKRFSEIAKTIGEATSGKTLRNYRKPDAEKAYNRIENKKTLSESELENHRGIIHQEQMEPIEPISMPACDSGWLGSGSSIIDTTAEAVVQANALTLRTSQSGALQRLVEQPDIAKWVEEGMRIHKSHDSERCEFCDQALPIERMASLAEHFGMEDQLLKQQIEKAVHECVLLKNALSSLALPSKLAFYPELREEYDKAAIHLNQEKEAFLSGITTITASFNKKLGLRSTSYSEDISVDTAVYVLALETISAIIKRHNDKTASFEREKSQAREALEAHYLSTIVDSVTEIDRQITELNERISQLRDGSDELEDKRGIQELSETIAQKQSQVSSAHAAGADLTEHLTRFLGRTDLKFDSTPEGYKVLRRGKLAKRLSEGEKTAIAFIYFLVQLKDQDFDLAEGVVVIDDPISSLDSSAIYQAFAFLKNGVKDAKQVFIFTHNFDFLKLLINWLRAGKRGDRSYYMVLCAESQAGRNARLERLDNLLVDHPTEYHYLFKVLHNFKSDGTILNAYHIPNIARKVLETFLDFHVPSDLSLYDKLEAINFDQHKKTAIYKFSNDLSHRTGKGFDPALVAETQKNTAHLLEMIKDIAPAHYNGLEKLSA